jgi:DNA-binding response OmpR family regulator
MRSDELRVLIADDDTELRALFKLELERRGIQHVHEARDGEEALLAALEFRPHVVLLDVMMPILNGWEVCKQIKRNPSIEDTRVLMLTGIGPSLNDLTSPLYGADSFLDKPVDFDVVLEQIRHFFPDISV